VQPIDASPFARTYALAAGPRVRLRLARRSDLAAVRALLHARGVPADDLDVSRLLAYHPSTRVVLCATAPLDGVDTLVGIGAIDLEPGAEPDAIVVDERLTAGLGELLGAVLTARADSRSRRAA
jgi:hypothetical protein